MDASLPTDVAVELYWNAVGRTPDTKTACIALIGAALACQETLRGVLPEAKVEDMINLLSVAGSLLIDDECDGLLGKLAPAGSA